MHSSFFLPCSFFFIFSFPSYLSVWTLTYCTCTIITEVPWIWNMLVMYAAPVAEQSWPRAEPPDSQSSASGARYTPGVLHAGSTTLPPAPSVQPPVRSPFGLAPSQAAPVLGLRAPLLGFDTTVTIPRHTQLYGNTFHIHFILTVAVLQSAAALQLAAAHITNKQQLQQDPIQTLSRRSMIADTAQVRPPAALQTKPRHRFAYVALVLYTNSLSFLELISRVIGPHKKSWQDKLILLFDLMANIKPHQFATISCGMISIVAGFRLVLKHNISTLSPLFIA